MAQGDPVLVISRVTRLETDVTALKTHQQDHESQIDTLAFGIDRIEKKLEKHDLQFIQLNKEIKFLHKRIDNGFARMDEQFKQLRDALAL